jgi:hypothetical protein
MSQITFADGTKASVNTNTHFTTGYGDPNQVPMTCTDILSHARVAGSRANFLKTYNLQGTQNTNMKVNLELLKVPMENIAEQDVSSAPGYTAIDTYLSSVQNTQIPVLQLVNACLSEASSPDTQELKELEKEHDEAKARYEGITTDVERVSYYQGWFPMFRPMKEVSLFVLFGVSMFIMLVTILLILHTSGITIHISFPLQFFIDMYSYFGHTLGYFMSYLIGGLIVGLICVVFAFIRGWI